MLKSIQNYCNQLIKEFDLIGSDRKGILKKLAEYIQAKKSKNEAVNLIYICTHNSRRSHFGQVWASVAANYYLIDQVSAFSGGTEATAFNKNAMDALKRIGFQLKQTEQIQNPKYKVIYGQSGESVDCFSKVYDHPINPKTDFAAVMTCSEAEQNCPFIPGVDLRIATTYDDPKASDGSALEAQVYDERCRQIACETFYVFSLIKNKL